MNYKTEQKSGKTTDMTVYDTHALIEKYSAMVYRIALSYTSNPADAEDIMQDVFLRYIKKSINFENTEHEKAWLIRVTVNRCKSFLTSPLKKRIVQCDEIESFGKKGGFENGKSSVYEAVMSLAPKQKLCVYLHYYEEMSVREISQNTGFPESTVKSHLFRARATLKKILKGEYFNV